MVKYILMLNINIFLQVSVQKHSDQMLNWWNEMKRSFFLATLLLADTVPGNSMASPDLDSSSWTLTRWTMVKVMGGNYMSF